MLCSTLFSEVSWNINHEDMNKSVFTTVYSADLKQVINDLQDGELDRAEAAHKLSTLANR